MFELVAAPGTQKTVATLAKAFDVWAPQYKVDTPTRTAMFIAQAAHETGGFRWLHELGDSGYLQYLEGREDLGNTTKGDGVKYKGRGLLMITGKWNYDHFGKLISTDLVNNPALAEDPEIAMRVSLAFWDERKLNQFADAYDVRGATKRINGGINGLQDRINKFQLLYEAMQKENA